MASKSFVVCFLLLNCAYHANTIGVSKTTDTSMRPRAFSVTSIWQFVQNIFNGIKQFIMTAFNYVKSIISSGMSLATRKDRMLDGLFENLPVLNWGKKGTTYKTTTVHSNVTKPTANTANVGRTADTSLQASASNNNGDESAPVNYDSITPGTDEANYNDNENSETEINYSANNDGNEENDNDDAENRNEDAETRASLFEEDENNEDNNYNNNDYNNNDY